MYYKCVETGEVKTLEEWAIIAVEDLMLFYESHPYISEEYPTFEEYREFVEQLGCLYPELVECDREGKVLVAF